MEYAQSIQSEELKEVHNLQLIHADEQANYVVIADEETGAVRVCNFLHKIFKCLGNFMEFSKHF